MDYSDELLHLETVSAFICDLPKAELHVHIEGTIEGDQVIEIADRNNIDLPYKTAEDVRSLQSQSLKNPHNNLANFLRCLDISRSVLKRGEDFYEIAMAFFRRCQAQNVVYVEAMFDPQQAIRSGVSFGNHFEALQSAGKEAESQLGVQVQWIMNFQRDQSLENALKTLEEADQWREHIIAVGLDNFETPGFPQIFAPLYDAARARGYHLTSHCDVNQDDSLQHIQDCIEVLGVSRIDHGLNTAQSPTLVEMVVEKNIALTGCPTFMASQGACAPDRIEMIRALLDAGALISVNTDDPAQFASGYICNVMSELQRSYQFTNEDLAMFTRNAFKSAWLPEQQKTRYLDAVSKYMN
ncbi:MAG: adenosine deaminase [Alphaproteobacteria bacterium]